MNSYLFSPKEKGRAVCANFLKASIGCLMLMLIFQTSMAQPTIIIDDPIGKWENLDGPEVQVYPNPAQEMITVSPPTNESVSFFTVIDQYGQVVLEQAISGYTSIAANLNAGTYYFRITTDQGVYHKTVVIL